MSTPASEYEPQPAARPGTVWEVFLVFLRLGLTSFGGPVAHIAYFREAFVVRRRWLTEKAYADLMALCQFLPGPASSQAGMALGLQRAGVGGLFAAWFAFTMPSVVLLVAFAYGVANAGDLTDAGWINGLKAAAVAVVAHAVLGMARSLTPDPPRATIAVGSMVVVLLVPSPFILVGAIALSGLIGLIALRAPDEPLNSKDAFPLRIPKAVSITCLSAFFVLLIGLPAAAAATGNSVLTLFDTFYRAGALVFGGGHVVLPLLEAETVGAGLIDSSTFLAGYGAAQAVPGPLFTFSGFLGASAAGDPTGLLGAVIAVLAIFLPGGLLVVGTVTFWEQLRSNRIARKALLGFNAGVVGVLGAALYSPVFTAGIMDTANPALAVCFAVAAFVALNSWKVPAWAVVIVAGLLGWVVL
ncbi:chromate efflux transporter [Nesterenkonia ebinurensis]|uniref:chromate efflux transporter n=1 Tax=Nesterenkonia ebinurensis TaxID=2608252 RepID=UPI00123E1060|nr:chromate efflux transporter [Nesterenkonia ebinurensis]